MNEKPGNYGGPVATARMANFGSSNMFGGYASWHSDSSSGVVSDDSRQSSPEAERRFYHPMEASVHSYTPPQNFRLRYPVNGTRHDSKMYNDSSPYLMDVQTTSSQSAQPIYPPQYLKNNQMNGCSMAGIHPAQYSPREPFRNDVYNPQINNPYSIPNSQYSYKPTIHQTEFDHFHHHHQQQQHHEQQQQQQQQQQAQHHHASHHVNTTTTTTNLHLSQQLPMCNNVLMNRDHTLGNNNSILDMVDNNPSKEIEQASEMLRSHAVKKQCVTCLLETLPELETAVSSIVSTLGTCGELKSIEQRYKFHSALRYSLALKYTGHWKEDGCAYRCIYLQQKGMIDRAIQLACRISGVNEKELCKSMPNHMIVWVDPGSVECQYGEDGSLGSFQLVGEPVNSDVKHSMLFVKCSQCANCTKWSSKVSF